jgi:hypothetical protein
MNSRELDTSVILTIKITKTRHRGLRCIPGSQWTLGDRVRFRNQLIWLQRPPCMFLLSIRCTFLKSSPAYHFFHILPRLNTSSFSSSNLPFCLTAKIILEWKFELVSHLVGIIQWLWWKSSKFRCLNSAYGWSCSLFFSFICPQVTPGSDLLGNSLHFNTSRPSQGDKSSNFSLSLLPF